jgi:structural maintenance of chromosome 2
MRPQEILGMVEEAAGTRMFEERKDKAKKTMSKKDKRVQEILSLLSEEITPKLEKLRSEKRSFLAYQKSCTELEKIARKLRAWDWCDGQQRVKKKDIEIEAKREEMRAMEEGRGRAVRECEAAEKEAEEVTKKRDAEMRKGGKMKKLEDNVAELGKELVKIKTQADLKESSIKDEEASVDSLKNELEEVCFFSPLFFALSRNGLNGHCFLSTATYIFGRKVYPS